MRQTLSAAYTPGQLRNTMSKGAGSAQSKVLAGENVAVTTPKQREAGWGWRRLAWPCRLGVWRRRLSRDSNGEGQVTPGSGDRDVRRIVRPVATGLVSFGACRKSSSLGQGDAEQGAEMRLERPPGLRGVCFQSRRGPPRPLLRLLPLPER